MCGEYQRTIAELKADGYTAAHIDGRGFYIDLTDGTVRNKNTGELRTSGNPLTPGMMVDEVWLEYTPKTKRTTKKYVVLDEYDETVDSFSSRLDANDFVRAEDEDGDLGYYVKKAA